jgi:hypothetical protein
MTSHLAGVRGGRNKSRPYLRRLGGRDGDHVPTSRQIPEEAAAMIRTTEGANRTYCLVRLRGMPGKIIPNR